MSHPPATFTLAGLPSFDHCVHHERSLRDVFALLESNSRIPGVMVFSGRRLVTVLSRSRLHNTTRRYSTVETFTPESPLSRLVANWPVKPTLLNADTSVEEATAIALSRGEESLAEPLVCVDARGRQTLIDIHTLMAAQCHQLALSNQRLAEASRSCELASKAKTDFLANMSHEIRTPMTAILGYAELLQDPGVDEAQRASAARTIRRSGEHLLNLLNDILDVSKVESGRLELERLDHDPVSLIREVVDLLRPRAHEKGVQLVLDVSSDTPAQVHTDPTRLRQIVSNLVGNAIKFTHSGQVRVTVNIDRSLGTDPASALLSVAVEDTGIGITSESIANLFQPFVQGDATMSRRYGGSGLGLTISRKLARLLGGDITVTSSPGNGSRFVATVSAGLERVSGRVLSKVEPTTTSADSALRGRILLAEDGPDNQRLFNLHLTRAGAVVDLACDGAAAVAKASAPGATYDLILMDMQMPVVDGYQATRALRDVGYRGPIVALTAHAMAADRERAIAAGCDDYLTKPIARDSLIKACQKWISVGQCTPRKAA